MARGSPSPSPSAASSSSQSSPSNSLDLSHPGVRFRLSPRLANGVIPEVLRARAGWEEVYDDEFFHDPLDSWDVHFADVGWCRERFKGGGDGVSREPLQPYQRVNHFPNHAELTRKDLLAKNLKAHRRRLEKAGKADEAATYDFVPETYALPNDYELFAEAFRRDEKKREETALVGSTENDPAPLYIAKPAGKAQGRGIFLFRRLNRLNPWRDANAARRTHASSRGTTVEPYVVQRYVERPLLIGGKKFDLRLYALVTSADPTRVYLHRAGFARFSTRRYHRPRSDENTTRDEPTSERLKENEDETGKKTNEAFSEDERKTKRAAHATTASLRDLRAHLTNVALNKTDDGYNDTNAQKFDLRALRLSLNGRFGEDAVDTLFRDIQNVVVKSVLACAPKFRKTSFAAGGDYLVENCFETYGFDVLIDDGLKPWLVEVNAAPSFVADTPSDAALKKKVVSDVLDVLDMESVVMERYGGGDPAVTRTKTVGGFDLLWDDGPVACGARTNQSKLGFFVEGL
jgi:tubulin polyglutamylase TTLL9